MSKRKRRGKNPFLATGLFAPAAWGGVMVNGRRKRKNKLAVFPVPAPGTYMHRRRARNPLEILPWILAGGASGAAAAAAARGMNRLLGRRRAKNPMGAMLAIVGANPGDRKRAGKFHVSYSPVTQSWSVYRGKRHVATTRDPEQIHYLLGGRNMRDPGVHRYPRSPRAAKTYRPRALTELFDGDVAGNPRSAGGAQNPVTRICKWCGVGLGYGPSAGGGRYHQSCWAARKAAKGARRNPLTGREVAQLVREARGGAKLSRREWSREPLEAAYYKGGAIAAASIARGFASSAKAKAKVLRITDRIYRIGPQVRDLRIGPPAATGTSGPGWTLDRTRRWPNQGRKNAFASHRRGCQCVFHAALRKKGKKRNAAKTAVLLRPLKAKGKPKPFLPSEIQFNPKVSRQARKFVSAKIRKLRHEGYAPKQAVAIAFGYARKAGYKVPKKNPAWLVPSAAFGAGVLLEGPVRSALGIGSAYGKRHAKRVEAANPGRPRKMTVSLERAREMGMPDFELNVREFMKFNRGARPKRVTVWVLPDGKNHKLGGYVQGKSPEVHYLGMPGSVKGGTHYVHKTKAGREPTLVFVPRTKTWQLVGGAMKVGGGRGREPSWLHD